MCIGVRKPIPSAGSAARALHRCYGTLSFPIPAEEVSCVQAFEDRPCPRFSPISCATLRPGTAGISPTTLPGSSIWSPASRGDRGRRGVGQGARPAVCGAPQARLPAAHPGAGSARLAGRRHHRPRLLPAARPERAGLFRRGCRHDLLGHGTASRPGGHPEPEGRPFGTRLRPRPALWRSRRARLRDQRPPALPYRFRRCRRPPVPAPRRQRRPVQRRQRRHRSQRDPEAPSGVSRAALPRLPLYPPRSGADRKPGDAAPPAGVRRARRPDKRSPHPQPDQRGLHQDRHPAKAHRTLQPSICSTNWRRTPTSISTWTSRSATSSSATTT